MHKFCVDILSYILGVYLLVELLDYIVTMFNFLENCQTFFKVAASFYLFMSLLEYSELHSALLSSIFSLQLLSEITTFTIILGVSCSFYLCSSGCFLYFLSSLFCSLVLAYHILQQIFEKVCIAGKFLSSCSNSTVAWQGI